MQRHIEPELGDATLPLPAQPSAASLARRFVAGHVADVDDQLRGDALLLVSELVTNAVRHGRGRIDLRIGRGPTWLDIGVHDGGAAMPGPVELADPTQTTGRGLHLVEALAERWGVVLDRGRPGKTVWFELRL